MHNTHIDVYIETKIQAFIEQYRLALKGYIAQKNQRSSFFPNS